MCGIVGLFLKDEDLYPSLGAMLTEMLVTSTCLETLGLGGEADCVVDVWLLLLIVLFTLCQATRGLACLGCSRCAVGCLATPPSRGSTWSAVKSTLR